jgi:hypothetical protein
MLAPIRPACRVPRLGSNGSRMSAIVRPPRRHYYDSRHKAAPIHGRSGGPARRPLAQPLPRRSQPIRLDYGNVRCSGTASSCAKPDASMVTSSGYPGEDLDEGRLVAAARGADQRAMAVLARGQQSGAYSRGRLVCSLRAGLSSAIALLTTTRNTKAGVRDKGGLARGERTTRISDQEREQERTCCACEQPSRVNLFPHSSGGAAASFPQCVAALKSASGPTAEAQAGRRPPFGGDPTFATNSTTGDLRFDMSFVQRTTAVFKGGPC